MKNRKQLEADPRIEKIERESGSYYVKLADGWLMEGAPRQNAFLAHSLKDLNRLLVYAERDPKDLSYEEQVQALEAKGITRSDAQSIVEARDL